MSQHRIGIDLGGTKIEIAVLAPDGSEAHRHRIDTPHGYQASLEGIAKPGARRGGAAWSQRQRSVSASLA